MNNQEPSRFTVLCSREVKIRLLEHVAAGMGTEIEENGALENRVYHQSYLLEL